MRRWASILHVELFDAIHESAHDSAIVGEDVGNLIGGVITIFNLATGVADGESISNSKLEYQGGHSQGFLASSLPVPQFAFASVAISLAMSSSEQGVPTLGNMASNLDMVDDMVLEDESTAAGVEVPDETWERLLI